MSEEDLGRLIDIDDDEGEIIESIAEPEGSRKKIESESSDSDTGYTRRVDTFSVNPDIPEEEEGNVFDDNESDVEEEYKGETKVNEEPDENQPILQEDDEEADIEEEDQELLEKMKERRSHTEKRKMTGRGKFDCLFCYRFGRIVCCYLGCCSIVQPLLIILIFVLATAMTLCSFYKSQLIGDFFVYFVENDYNHLWYTLLVMTFLQTISACCASFMSFGFIQLLLYYFWRKKLTKALLKKYFKSKNYYEILHMNESTIDNPDQRIQEDVKEFCFSLSLSLVTVIENSITVIFFFAIMIYQRSYLLLIPVFLWPPINMCCYGVCFTPLANQIFRKDAAEGDFRFSHARIREFSESIAFYKSSAAEKKNVVDQFNRVIWILLGLAIRYMFLNGWTVLSSQCPQITIIFFILIMVFADMHPFDKDKETADVSGDLNRLFVVAKTTTDAVGSLFAIASALSVVIGNTARIGEMLEVFDKIQKREKQRNKFNKSTPENGENEGDPGLPTMIKDDFSIRFENVTTETLKGVQLHKNLNFAIEKGQSVIIMGPSGCGKSSLLRQLAGLWETRQGKIHKPSTVGRNGLFFLPQRPYLVRGTLKDNIIYPFTPNEVHCSDERLIEVLKLANVDYILNRASLHEVNVCWDEKLSIGEQQRVAVSRLFLHKPRFAVLDESTSALDPENEEKIYFNIKRAGITMISVAHRRSVMKYHEFVLHLSNDGSGEYEYRKIRKEELPQYDSEWEDVIAKHVVGRELRDREDREADDQVLDQELRDGDAGGAGINVTFLRRFVHLFLGGILVRKCSDCCFMGFVVFIAFVNSFMILPIIIFTGTINASIASRNVGLTILYTFLVILSIALIVIVSVGNDFLFSLQGIMWRKNLVNFLQEKYFEDQRYYELNILSKKVDNADQRICQDADFLTSGFSSHLGLSYIEKLLLGSLIMFILLVLSTETNGSQMIMIVCVLVLLFVTIGQMIALYFLSRVQFLQQKKEGYFRFFLTRLKEYSEQIAFYDGKYVEQRLIEDKFSRVCQNLLKFVLIQSISTCYVALTYNFSSILGYFLLVLTAWLEIVDVSKMSTEDAIGMLVSKNLSVQLAFVGMLGVLSSSNMFGVLSGNLSRVVQFIESMEELEKRKHDRSTQHMKQIVLSGDSAQDIIEVNPLIKKTKSINSSDYDEDIEGGSDNNNKKKIIIPKYDDRIETLDYIQIENLTAETPIHKKLYFHLDIHIGQEDSVIIIGPSGCGKSSLLRIIAGLWPTVSGRIFAPQRVGNGGIFFLPQKPYLILGSLRDQVIYPDTFSESSDEELLEILKRVNLEYLYVRLEGDWNVVKEWSTILSPGEQQRIGVARCLYHRPLFCLLDESTSALDEENEKIMMGVLKKENISIISVGHRRSLLEYHDLRLSFDGLGGWVYARKSKEQSEIEYKDIDESSDDDDVVVNRRKSSEIIEITE